MSLFNFFGNATETATKDIKAVEEKNDNDNDSSSNNNNNQLTLFHFDKYTKKDGYTFPDLYDEADSMLQVALLIYTVTDLRTLAKKKDTPLKSPERILTLPIKFGVCLEMIEENIDLIIKEFGDDDHSMTMSALQSIQQRYEHHAASSSSSLSLSSKNNNNNGQQQHQWWNPFFQMGGGGSGGGGGESESIEIEEVSPYLSAYGDENPFTDLVYAVGVDPLHKRITVSFRGSVTPTDFLTDACISINLQPNPVYNKGGTGDDEQQSETVGLHHGFYEYLLKPRKDGKNKYEEILTHVVELFQDKKMYGYKLYVTGHSLGGALATLFSFHVAASKLDNHATGGSSNNNIDTTAIPLPISCVSVASPRVGEGTFQSAFRYLEERGLLRHLRIANDRDPVTIMPKSSGKKVWAQLSPVSYMAFKMMDNKFEDKETYRHTGIKLRLYTAESKKPKLFDIEYSGAAKSKEEKAAEKAGEATIMEALGLHKIPNVVLHMGKAYTDNLISIKEDLKKEGMTLNDLYKKKALNSPKP